LSSNLHGGAQVVNYPYDNYKNAGPSKEERSTDDDVFRTMALNYSANNVNLRGVSCNNYFPDGTTNGGKYQKDISFNYRLSLNII
jgi:hypothetical protein